MCKRSRELVDHLLRHCPITIELWTMVWNLFSLLWVMPQGVTSLFSAWQGLFGKHRNIVFLQAMPHYVMWCWWEQNAKCFEGSEWYILNIKSLLLHTLLDWSKTFNSLPYSNLLDMFEYCNLRDWCFATQVYLWCP